MKLVKRIAALGAAALLALTVLAGCGEESNKDKDRDEDKKRPITDIFGQEEAARPNYQEPEDLNVLRWDWETKMMLLDHTTKITFTSSEAVDYEKLGDVRPLEVDVGTQVMAWKVETDAHKELFDQDETLYEVIIAANGGDVICNDTSYLFDLTDVSEYVDFHPEYFYLTEVVFDRFDMSGSTSMEQMFGMCTSLRYVDVSGLDTSGVTSMAGVFRGCRELAQLDVSGWDTSNVEDMGGLFMDCKSLARLDLSGWDTSRVKEMECMFANCRDLEQVDMTGWNTDNVYWMMEMFYECSSLEQVDLSGWNTANVESLERMFYHCSSLRTVDAYGWDLSKVQSTVEMFEGCTLLEKVDVTGWDVSNVMELWYMFWNCTSLVDMDISGWEFHPDARTDAMFSGVPVYQKYFGDQ